MSIDPEDPRPPFQQVASALRAAILTRKFEPGDKLPSGPELAKTYGVARMTVQQAVRLLRDEGLVVSQQGRGVFVRQRTSRPVGLRPHIERAFTSQTVTIDFAGFGGETLHGALQEPLDKVREGRLTPETIRMRILVPDLSASMGLPVRTDTLADDPDVRNRMRRIMLRNTQGIEDAVHELESLGLVQSAVVRTRVYSVAPMFKLYLINGQEAFFGYYPVKENIVSVNKEKVEIFDLMGRDATLFHHAADEDPESTGSQYVAQSQVWFNSIWENVSREREE
ncbi:GntR family transcriptional regulator [Nocardiopsis ansamitocini]|uniref:GntR family transcriptional regulator n=1 Tax=Nocardiopsis ansamitocini TaxID=1670832 RepID=A0A9W6P9Z6_9ACTN|nr:GntR family transcriptional regulator [Nocardiopsis ansamitocini]GLU49841.1 GntR family transcriptional regulator [Nocardiopsis ansamitocini]